MTKFFLVTPRKGENIGQILTYITGCLRAIFLRHSVASWTVDKIKGKRHQLQTYQKVIRIYNL